MPASADYTGTPGKVAYLSSDYHLFIDDLHDGSVPKPGEPLSPGGAAASVSSGSPVWKDLSGPYNQWAPGSSESAPVFSPDGTRLAFVKFKQYGACSLVTFYTSQIWVENADGSTAHVVTTPPPLSCDSSTAQMFSDTSPSWSPDGKTLAFVRTGVASGDTAANKADGGVNVWTVPVADDNSGGSASKLTDFPNGGTPEAVSVAWSPTDPDTMLAAVHYNDGEWLSSLSDGADDQLVKVTDPGLVDYDWAPDGKSFAWLDGNHVAHIADMSGNDTETIPNVVEPMRFSPDGNGLIYPHSASLRGYTSGAVTAWFEHRLNDSTRDLRTSDPYDMDAPVLGLDATQPNLFLGDGLGRTIFDVQAQQLPVIFLPGLMGSDVDCGGVKWPVDGTHNAAQLDAMNLTDNGSSDASGSCKTFPVAGRPYGTPVPSILGSDVYGGTTDWVTSIAPGGIANGDKTKWPESESVGWDWRKSPGDNLAEVQQVVSDALSQDEIPKKEGATRVTIVAHSYGGLLTTMFLKQHPDEVARALTIGTPYWGAPNALLPMLAGIHGLELGDTVDILLHAKAHLRQLARNLRGVYELYPSAHFGGWLTGGGAHSPLDVAGLIAAENGNAALYASAQADHANTLDSFWNGYNQIDVRQVAGAGLVTNNGFWLGAGADCSFFSTGNACIGGISGDGDGTVPKRSAIQGTDPTNPLGDKIHIQFECNVDHMHETSDATFRSDYKDFLLSGRLPLKMHPSGCSGPNGSVVTERGIDIPDTGPLTDATADASPLARLEADAASDPLTIEQADADGLIDFSDYGLYAPGEASITTNSFNPVKLSFTGTNAKFTVTPVADGAPGSPVDYGPATGTFVYDATSLGAPQVYLDGHLLSGTPEQQPGGGGQSSGAPGGSAGGTVTAHHVTSVTASVKSGKLVVGYSSDGAGTVSGSVAAVLKSHRGSSTIGKASARIDGPGRYSFSIKLSAAAKKALAKRSLHATLRVSLSPADGSPAAADVVRVKLARLRHR